MSRANWYNYKYISESNTGFRLLTLLPGQTAESIQCLSDEYSLLHVPVYEALSYQWGQPGDAILIKVDDNDFQVQPNLHQCVHKLSTPCSWTRHQTSICGCHLYRPGESERAQRAS